MSSLQVLLGKNTPKPSRKLLNQNGKKDPKQKNMTHKPLVQPIPANLELIKLPLILKTKVEYNIILT